MNTQMNDVQVSNVTVTPVNQGFQTTQQIVQETAQAINEAMNGFSDQPIGQEEQKARSFLGQFTNYIKSDLFKKDVEDAAKKTGVPPKKIAQNFFEKALGTVGDILGIAVGTVKNAADTLINLLSTVAHGAVSIVCNVANALVSMVTLNKTCVA